MAKRYTRINWQNKPNTATPISAENLNKMDKGIKDCDDAIGDLALLNTTNKTDLVAAVNELNNNLAKMPFTCTALSGYTIVSSNCFVQNKIAYINLRIDKIDGSSFSSDIQDIATVPHMPVSAVTALCAIGLSAGGVMQTIERCGIFAYSRGITIRPASTDTKSVYLTGTYEINI